MTANDSRQLIQSALRMKNMMRPGPMEMRKPAQSAPVPPRPMSMPAQMPPAPHIPDIAPRRGVYQELMRKHDALNPRLKHQ